MNYSMRLIQPPTVEPVTVDEVKIYAHIDHDVDDALILQWIKAARMICENYQRRAYYEQVWLMSFDCFPYLPLLIPRPPLVSVDYVRYFATDNTATDITATDYYVDTNSEPGRIAHAYGVVWPTATLRPIDGVHIRYTCGFQDSNTTTTTSDPSVSSVLVPEYVKDAIYLYCGYRNENRSGEVPEVPQQFYDLLNTDGFYTPGS